MADVLTLEQARTERLETECRRRMTAAARIDASRPDGRKAKDAVIAEIDRILDQLALTLPEPLCTESRAAREMRNAGTPARS